MEMGYRMMALDMDGTVVNDSKRIDEKTSQAIHDALAAGKEVVFCTGRSYSEMADILIKFPDMHYLCGESGALIYDLKAKKPLVLLSVTEKMIADIEQVIQGRDIMLQFMCEGQAAVSKDQISRMDHYQMGVYQEIFSRVCRLEEDLFRMVRKESCSVEKINLFHTSVKEREISRKMLELRHFDGTMVDSEISSLECTALGVNKAVGLKELCRILGIPMEQVIMVGDAENDRAALEAAGFSVAVGNAVPAIKEICDAVVADNNHDGCAEAIRRFLL